MGTMKTQRDSLPWGCWSLLLLGLLMPPATAQDLSYKQAVLLAVKGFNQRSSEASLYRLLELEGQPKGVSWGGMPASEVLLPPRLATLPVLCFYGTSCPEGASPFKWDPTSSRKPS